MERNLEKQIEEICRVPGISGALCADQHGLCLASRGIAKPETAGSIANIAAQAAQLHPNSTSSPVISIEAEAGSVLIKTEDEITMAIYKHPS